MQAVTKADVVGIFRLMTALFPQSARHFENADAVTRDAWYELVKDIPKELLLEAVKSYAAGHVFAPSVAELRAEALKAARPELSMGADEAWGLVVQAVKKYGYTRPMEALSSLPQIVARCVERFGWREICLSDKPEAVRGQFYKAFEAQIQREKADALVPNGVKTRMARLTSGWGNALALAEGE